MMRGTEGSASERREMIHTPTDRRQPHSSNSCKRGEEKRRERRREDVCVRERGGGQWEPLHMKDDNEDHNSEGGCVCVWEGEGANRKDANQCRGSEGDRERGEERRETRGYVYVGIHNDNNNTPHIRLYADGCCCGCCGSSDG